MQPQALILVFDKVAHHLIKTDTYSYSNHDVNVIRYNRLASPSACY